MIVSIDEIEVHIYSNTNTKSTINHEKLEIGGPIIHTEETMRERKRERERERERERRRKKEKERINVHEIKRY
jgi:hypothetical protein